MLKHITYILIFCSALFYSCKKDVSPYPTPAVPKADTVVTLFKLQDAIYPNPNRGIFTISTNTTDSQNVQLYNRWGQEILNLNINGTTAIVDTNLQDGMYVMRISSKLGTFENRIVVLK